MFRLDRLEVYQQAMQLARICAQHAAGMRDFSLRTQLLRSTRSIAANLAEGAGSASVGVFARHVGIALGSAKETECHLDLAVDAGELSRDAHTELRGMLENLTPRLVRLLAALRRNAKRRSA